METVTCIGCGNYFELSDAELDYFSKQIEDKNPNSPTFGEMIQLRKPKRCKDCRAKKQKH